MKQPTLTVIAGCNGAGKSSFSRAITSEKSPSFDYDLVYIEKYNSLLDSDIRDQMAHNLAREVLEKSIEQAIQNKTDFSYETNFNSTPLFWPKKFKMAGFQIRLVFFCLSTIEEAKRRVQIRVENGGHFVPEIEIIKRYNLGFEHLDLYWSYFDEVYLFDTSTYSQEPKFILSLIHGKVDLPKKSPTFLAERIPSIYELVKK